MLRRHCGQDIPDYNHGLFSHFDMLAAHQLVHCVEDVIVDDIDSGLVGVAGDVWEDPKRILLPWLAIGLEYDIQFL